MTPEGSVARNKALMIKELKLFNNKPSLRNSSDSKQNALKHGYCTAEAIKERKESNKKDLRRGCDIDPKMIDRMIRDLQNYNYHYIPIKQIETKTDITNISIPSMNMKYIAPTNIPSCPKCNYPNIDREPLLKKLPGIRWHCWQCNGEFVKGSDGILRKVESETDKEKPKSELEKLMGTEAYQAKQHKGKQIIEPGGIPGQSKGTPNKPRIIKPPPPVKP